VAQTNFRESNAVSNESGSSRNADPLSFGYLNAQSLVLNRFNQPSYDLSNKQVQFRDQSLQAKELRERQQDQARGVTDTSQLFDLLPSHLNSNDTTLNRSGDTSKILNANQARGGPVNLGPDSADNQDLPFLGAGQPRNQYGPSSHSALSHALQRGRSKGGHVIPLLDDLIGDVAQPQSIVNSFSDRVQPTGNAR